MEEERLTSHVRALLQSHDEVGAVRATLRFYGPELYGFLVGVLDDAARAESVYADVQTRLETEIGGFVGRCTLRTWLYVLTRRELRDRRRQGRATTASRRPLLSAERSISAANAISDLRTGLTEEERELLILRVDRRFSWLDVALTELGDRETDRYQLAATTRAVRARVEAVIARLRRVAAEEMNDPPRGAP